MDKNQVMGIEEELKRTRTDKLENYVSTLAGIIHDLEVSEVLLSRSGTNHQHISKQHPSYYFRDIHLKMGKHELCYYRKVSMYGKKESLKLDGQKITVADIYMLMHAFGSIITHRK